MNDMSAVVLGNVVTVTDAAILLGISVQRIHQFIKEERLRAKRKAGRWLIDAESLAEFAQRPRRRGNPNFSRKSS